MLTKETVKRVQAKGFEVNTWTVNELKAIERITHFNVDAIISDFPDRI